MTLLIAVLVLASMDASGWAYAGAVVLWVGHIIFHICTGKQ